MVEPVILATQEMEMGGSRLKSSSGKKLVKNLEAS
jgi:hypothetical protein